MIVNSKINDDKNQPTGSFFSITTELTSAISQNMLFHYIILNEITF